MDILKPLSYLINIYHICVSIVYLKINDFNYHHTERCDFTKDNQPHSINTIVDNTNGLGWYYEGSGGVKIKLMSVSENTFNINADIQIGNEGGR